MSTEKTSRRPKFKPIQLAIYALILGVAGYIIIRSQAAPAAPTIYLSPASQTLAAGTTFTVAVRENSGSTAVNALQANFSYDQTLVDFVSIDATGSAFTTQAQATGGAGSVQIARAIIGSLTGDQLVANVTFKAKTSSGTAAMAFTTGTALLDSTNNQNLIPSLTSTGGSSFVIDATAPTTAITAPTGGAVISGGSTTNITASASDNTGVAKVEIYVDGTLKTTLTTGPYTYSWNTTGVTLGNHTIQSKAYDNYALVGSSAIITVSLTDQTAPTVSVTAPTAGSTVAGTVTLTANATDNTGGSGVAKVEFYIDNVLKGTDTTSPYSVSFDTKTITDGSHNFVAKAYDLAATANVGTSTAVTATVQNADIQAPSVPGSLRTTANSLTGITLAWNASTDNIGVTGYRVQRNGTTIATVTTLAYADTGLASGTSYTYTVTALDAANNTSTAATLSASTMTLKPGDINKDNSVGVADLSLLLSKWGTTDASCDINTNGTVDVYDLSILLSNYGK